jgi:hypothetical protein
MDHIHNPRVPGSYTADDPTGYDDTNGNTFPYTPGRHERPNTPNDAPGHYSPSTQTNSYGIPYASHNRSRRAWEYLNTRPYRAAHRAPDSKRSAGWDAEAYAEDSRPVRRIYPSRNVFGVHRFGREQAIADWERNFGYRPHLATGGTSPTDQEDATGWQN